MVWNLSINWEKKGGARAPSSFCGIPSVETRGQTDPVVRAIAVQELRTRGVAGLRRPGDPACVTPFLGILQVNALERELDRVSDLVPGREIQLVVIVYVVRIVLPGESGCQVVRPVVIREAHVESVIFVIQRHVIGIFGQPGQRQLGIQDLTGIRVDRFRIAVIVSVVRGNTRVCKDARQEIEVPRDDEFESFQRGFILVAGNRDQEQRTPVFVDVTTDEIDKL